MLNRKSLATLMPVPSPEDRGALRELIHDNPWLVPSTMALQVLPLVVIAHGYWKTRQLKTQLQIEREKTKQLRINQYRPGVPQPLAHHSHFHHD